MTDPSSINWKQYSLFGGLVVAIMVLLGFVAHALGIIEFRSPGPGDDPVGVGGASPSDIITTDAPIDSVPNSGASETTEPAAEGTWTAKYEGQILPLDSSPAGTDECTPLGFELDEVTDAGFVFWRTDSDGSASDDIDLIWDDCTGHEDNEVYLSSSATSFGSLWAEDTVFDAEGCHADIEDFPIGLFNTIDPVSPSETWFTEGQVLCMRTSDEQIVIADLTSVEPATDEYPGMKATFEVTLWVRA
jgi:hypothetical protein